MADINQINLSLDKLNVESTSTSIVREYLARKVILKFKYCFVSSKGSLTFLIFFFQN